MITLRTGVPGSGKTLSLVAELLRQFERDGKADKPPRPVFVHGIPDLALPCLPLPVYAPVINTKAGAVQVRNALEVDWSVVPDGAHVVIDEAQHLFPPRGAGAAVPGYVAFLNTHRHRGIDIELISQHPRLLDQAVRKLVGRHMHYRRLFGGGRHVVYEWDSCSESLAGYATATKTIREFPKRAFAAYKSAELHTKPKAAKPLWLAVPVLALVGLAAVGPTAWGVMSGAMSGKGVGSDAGKAADVPALAASSGGMPRGVSAVDLAAGQAARSRLALYDDRMPPPKSMPYHVGGCWVDARQCRCVTNEVRPRIVTDLGMLCVSIARGDLAPHPERPRPERVPDGGAAGTLAVPAPAASGAVGPGVTAADAAARMGRPA